MARIARKLLILDHRLWAPPAILSLSNDDNESRIGPVWSAPQIRAAHKTDENEGTIQAHRLKEVRSNAKLTRRVSPPLYSRRTPRPERDHTNEQTTTRAEQATPRNAAPHCIAIDGPVASGKSAVGSRLARRLGYRLVDTGMMYRAITCLALDQGTDLEDNEALARLGSSATLQVESGPPDNPEASRVFVNSADVTGRLRSLEVGEAVSLVSRVPGVRAAMVAIQRKIAQSGSVVMVGRDIGTVVLPDARLKVYLDASVEERVRRRHAELLEQGRPETLNQVRDELAMRDQIDSARDTSPLRPADDALVLDTDTMTIQEVVDRILKEV